MRLDEIDRPRGIDEVAAILLDLDFPVDLEPLVARVGHVMLENRDGALVAARDLLGRMDRRGFRTPDEVVVALLEALGIGVIEVQLDVVKPTAGEVVPDADDQAAAAGDDQLIDATLREDAAAGQAIERDRDAAAAEQREQMRGRQRERRYVPPDGPVESESLDTPHPPLLDPSSAPERRR